MVREYCEIRQEIINIQSTLIACQKMRSVFFWKFKCGVALIKIDTGRYG